MSKHTYGWSGHILARECQVEDDEARAAEHNVIGIPDELFDRIIEDYENCTLPSGICAERLGSLSVEPAYFLATGTGFTEGYTFYGAPFEEAELRLERDPLIIDADAEYLAVMKSHYGLDLPRCRLMIGCSFED